MLQSINHPDVREADDAAVGFNVTGNVPVSFVFDARGMVVAKSSGRQMRPWWKTPALEGEPTRQRPRKSTTGP